MTGMTEISIRRRIWGDKIFKTLIIVLSLGSTVPMFLILFMITKNGVSVIDWQFLAHLPKPVGIFALAGAVWRSRAARQPEPDRDSAV